MADRTSAGIFSDIFTYLAKQPDSDSKYTFAREMWKHSQNYDFSNYQLECDKALVALGLAKRGKGFDPDYPEDVVTVYADSKGNLK